MIIKVWRTNGYWFQYDPDRPYVRFLGGGPSKPKLPPPPDPVPTPEDVELQAMQKGEAERRRLRGLRGRLGTILTEVDTLGATARTKSPILGIVGE